MRPRPHVVKEFLFWLLAMVIFLGAGEGLARLVEMARYGPASAEDEIPPKSEGAFRVLLLGGSTVFGEPLPELSFVRQLEHWLRRLRPTGRLEVINLGARGQSSDSVLEKLRSTIDKDPDLLIVLSGHNEFLQRREGSVLQELRAQGLRHSALVRLTQRVIGKFYRPELSRGNVMPDRLLAYDRGSDSFRQRVAGYRRNLGEIAALANGRRIPLLLCTLPANLADWPPVSSSSANGAAYLDEAERVRGMLAAGEPHLALAATGAFLADNPDDALFLFFAGRAHAAAGRPDTALGYFVRARDLDPYPWRVLSELNDTVRDLGEMPGVYLVDVERALGQAANHGLVGFSLIADNCHPTPLGGAVIVRVLLLEMGRQKFFLDVEPKLPAPDQILASYLESLGDRAARDDLWLEYLLNTAIYSMKTPFYNYRASERYLDEAAALDPQDWRVWANRAALRLLEDNIEEGRELLERATLLKGAVLEPEDRKPHPYLKEALEHTGVELPDVR